MNKRPGHTIRLGLLVLICLVGLASGCKTKKSIQNNEVNNKFSSEIIEQALAAEMKYESFSAKISADIKIKGQANSFKATLRAKKDSAIWVSISPALGIEVFRLVCTQDSVKYVDKLNNRYFLGDYKALNNLTNSVLSLEAIENILTGNLLHFDTETKYRVKSEADSYYLATRNTNRLRKIVRADKSEALAVIPDTLSTEQINERRLHRFQEKRDEDELIVRQYWFSAVNMKVIQSIFTDLASEISLVAKYAQHEEIEGQIIPTNVSIDLGNASETAMFRLSYSKIKLNSPVEMPFSIPEKYEQVFR